MVGRGRAATKPECVEALDPDMRTLWDSLGPLPGDLRLYGVPALMLYLDHRKSVDFDFATPRAVVDRAFVGRIPAFAAGRATGGPGLVDVVLQGRTRELKATFMECGHLIPPPSRPPVVASNGVAVAHPVDLVAAKMEACIARGATRDFQDVAAAIGAWPGWARQGARALAKPGGRRIRDIQCALASPPRDVAGKLSASERKRLRAFALSLTHGREAER